MYTKIRKKVLLTIYIFSLFLYAKPQQVQDIYILPQLPSYMDSINVVSAVMFPFGYENFCPNIVNIETSSYNSTLYLDLFFDISGAWPSAYCYSLDTVNIGRQNVGIYSLIVSLHTVLDGEPMFYCDSDTISFNVLNDIEEYNQNSSFIVYPNPANNKLFINYKDNISINQLILLDLQGRVIRNYNVKQKELNLRGIKDGLYLLNVVAEEKSYFRKIFIN